MSCIPNILLIQGKESTSSSVPIIFLKFLLETYLCFLQLKLVRLLILFVVLFHSVDTMCIDYNISHILIFIIFKISFTYFALVFKPPCEMGEANSALLILGVKKRRLRKYSQEFCKVTQ